MSSADSELQPGLLSTAYVYDSTHYLLAPDAHRLHGANIGRHGHNLTISFLSLNRASLSTRLIRSIRDQLPNFAGEVLVIDQGSTEAELAEVKGACDELRCAHQVVELGKNFGVAGGRNRTMPHVRTEWVMCLDNDMVFTADPLRQIQKDIALLGCHFLNLPLLDKDGHTLFAKGGHLYTETAGNDIRIGGGSACGQKVHEGGVGEPFLSTFLFGGASVLNKETFQAVGGYDEAMFVGFEDIDFSVRLFQKGLKVGNTTCVALVHDHPPPAAPADEQYERGRYAREVLKRSAEHLEAKHGMTVWSAGVEEWLKVRRQEMGAGEESVDEAAAKGPAPATVPAAVKQRARPKVALVVDTDSWAFWNISQQLRRHLGDRFEFRIIVCSVIDNAIQVFLVARECDIIHVFWREYLGLLLEPDCKVHVEWFGGNYTEFLEKVIKSSVVSTCIYDHLHLDEAGLRNRLPLFRDLVDAYYVGSERLRKIYAGLADFPDPLMVLEDGIDPELFYPVNAQRFDRVGEREVVIGWTGNSEWAAESGDIKGVRTILRPAVEQLIAEGLPLRLHLADRAEGGPMIPHSQMVNYYGQIDVYICTSEFEGTPNPVLESMACGVPVISTDVGIVSQALGPQQKEFILKERSIECLKAAIGRLVSRPQLLGELSRENLDYIKPWHWQRKAQGFGEYFDRCLRLKLHA